jgi:hypothetical protein
MSDQADNLRQLVRAQSEWRELVRLDLAEPGPWRFAGHVAVNREAIGTHDVSSEENSCKRREDRRGTHDFPVVLTMSLKRVVRIVRYLIGMEFLARRGEKGQAGRFRRAGSD